MGEQNAAFIVTPLVASHFKVGGEASFPLDFFLVPDELLVDMIEAYLHKYPTTIDDNFVVPDRYNISAELLRPTLEVFGRLTADADPEETRSLRFSDDRMAAAIFSHLLLVARGWPSLGFLSYEGLVSTARSVVDMMGATRQAND